MLARFAGFLAGLAAFFVYFTIIGTDPVLTTLLGVGLALVIGIVTWLLLEKRMGPARNDHE